MGEAPKLINRKKIVTYKRTDDNNEFKKDKKKLECIRNVKWNRSAEDTRIT